MVMKDAVSLFAPLLPSVTPLTHSHMFSCLEIYAMHQTTPSDTYRNMPRRSHLFTHEPPSPVSSSVFSLCSVGDAPPTSTLISASHSLHRLLTASTPSISHTLTHSHTQRAGTNTSCTAASFQVPHPITAGKHTGYRNEKEINKKLRKSSNTFCPFH